MGPLMLPLHRKHTVVVLTVLLGLFLFYTPDNSIDYYYAELINVFYSMTTIRSSNSSSISSSCHQKRHVKKTP